MPPGIQAQASQAAAQGQQQYSNDQNQAAASKAQYGTYQGQADAANQAVQQQAQYMQGAGSGTNLYNTELGNQMTKVGYDPAQMTAAQGNLNQSTGALSAYSDFANTGAAKFGLNAGGFAAANAGALGNLNNNIATQQGVVNGLTTKYGLAQTGANQSAGLGVQNEQNTLGGLQSVYTNAASSRDQAAQMMQFYHNLAQQQGTLNASQQQAYATAQQQYAAAGQAAAQAALLVQQHQQQAKLFADQQTAAQVPPVHNTGIGVIAPGHTGITNGNGSVVGVR